MGEGQKRSAAKEHRKSLSRVPEDCSAQASIFGGLAAIVSDIVECILVDGQAMPQLQSAVQLVDYGKEIRVIMGVRIVGHVCENGTRMLRQEHGISKEPGSRIQGTIVGAEPDWGTFDVKIGF